jgi:hypothetical protein
LTAKLAAAFVLIARSVTAITMARVKLDSRPARGPVALRIPAASRISSPAN